jgi:hypothetical protein
MRTPLVLAVLLLVGCGDSKATVYEKYLAAASRDAEAYSGNDASVAYQAKLEFIDYVKKLRAENAPISIPYESIYVWNYARLGLLAEHLGRKTDALRFFRLAVGYAKKSDPKAGDDKTSEAALRSALDQMDTPDRVAWRRK